MKQYFASRCFRARYFRAGFWAGGYAATAPGLRADALRVVYAGAEVRHLHRVGTVPGVAPLAAAGRNGPGAALLRTTADALGLQWRAPGSETLGPVTPIPADGEYLVEDGEDRDSFLRVQVARDWLAGGHSERAVQLQDVYNNAVAGDDVDMLDGEGDDVQSWDLTLHNAAAEDLIELCAWIDPAVTWLEISANGSDWSAPTARLDALALKTPLTPAEETSLYVRRTIPGAADADPRVLSHLHFHYSLLS